KHLPVRRAHAPTAARSHEYLTVVSLYLAVARLCGGRRGGGAGPAGGLPTCAAPWSAGPGLGSYGGVAVGASGPAGADTNQPPAADGQRLRGAARRSGVPHGYGAAHRGRRVSGAQAGGGASSCGQPTHATGPDPSCASSAARTPPAR